MDVPDKLRARANQPRPPAIDEVREFLRGYVADCDGLDDLRADLVRMAQVNRETVRRKAAAIEALLAAPPAPGTLATLVTVDGNWVLEETSDAAAAVWLHDVAALIHGVLLDPDNGHHGS
jgi:hypothetical protein